MYDFPPDIERPGFWVANLAGFAALVIGSGFNLFLNRKSRTACVYDASLMLIIVALQSWLMTSSFGDAYFHRYPHKSLLATAWTFALAATVFNWLKVPEEKYRHPLDRSFGLWLVTLLPVSLLLMIASADHSPSNYTSYCRNMMRNFGIAWFTYEEEFGSLPAAAEGNPPHSWRVAVLPYIDESDLFNAYVFDEEWNKGTNDNIAKKPLEIYLCRAHELAVGEQMYPLTSYAVVVDENTAWKGSTGVKFDEFNDGVSNTILLVEACGQQIPWAEPRDIVLDDTPIGINLPGSERHRSDSVLSTYHGDTANVIFADGSARALTPQTSPEIIKALLTRNGGENVEEFWK